MIVCAKVEIQIKIQLQNFRLQIFASIWNRSASNKRAAKFLQNRLKLSSQVLRQKSVICTCVWFKLFGLCARISLQTSLISLLSAVGLQNWTTSNNPGKHEFPHFCVETEGFMVNKMFKTQQKYSEFCLVQTNCFSVGFQSLLQPVRNISEYNFAFLVAKTLRKM